MENETLKNIKMHCLLAVMGILISSQVSADPVVYTRIFSDKAMSGYDSVAYFAENKPVKGNEKYKYEYLDAIWYFKSQENVDKFKASPTKYAPQYGGYCAWSVSQGNNASGDPEQWLITGGKLYLNYDQEIHERWLASRDFFIKEADKNWPSVLN